MSARQVIEERLRASEHQFTLEGLASLPSVQPTRVFRVSFSTDGKVGVIHIPACDTAIYFDGLHCPFEGITLLIEREVAVAWELM